MKKYLLIAFVSVINLEWAVAQGKKPVVQTKPATEAAKPTQQAASNAAGEPSALATHYLKKYGVATRWNDLEVAKDALYDLIVEYPSSDSLIFTLAYHYFENQKYPSSALICQDLIARNPRNAEALEVAGESYQALNINDRALQNFESLYLLTSNPATLYKMVYLQVQLKRYQECLTSADILLSKPEANDMKVVFADAENKQKEYPVKVAILNLKGMAYKEQSDKVNARKFFEEALQLAPDFVPAKQNLASLK